MPEITKAMDQGRFVVWIDDKTSALTPEYIEAHFVAIVDSLEEGYDLCAQLQDEERKKDGIATTRYRISSRGKDYVCSEDMNEDAIIEILKKMPLDEKEKWRAIEELNKGRK